MPINVVCTSCNQTVAAPESMAGKRAVCPNCRAVIVIPEQFAPARLEEPGSVVKPPPEPTSDPALPPPDITAPAIFGTQADDEKAALRILRLIYVFFRRDWRRMLTCAHLWPAFFLFFLPWVNVSCTNRTIVTQTGLQSCYGATTLNPKFEKLARNDKGPPGANLVKPKLDEPPPWSVLSIVYILFVFLGGFIGLVCIVCVLFRLHTVAAGIHLFSLGLGCAAFLAITAQMIIGFPVEKHVKSQLEKIQQEQRQRDARFRANDEFDLIDIEATYSAWLWFSLFLTLVSVPVFLLEFVILIVDAINKHMRQRDDSG